MQAAAHPRVILAGGASDVGRQRTVNEDRFFVDVERGMFVVADGLGGQAAGETAAETAIAAVRERLGRRTGTAADRVREAITIANNEIHRLAAARPEWHGMACVLTVAIVDGPRAVVGHVGDSRLYRLHGATIEKITPDHSPVGEREDAREISELEAMRHPRRHEVYRDVGSEPRDVADADFVFVTEIDLPSDAALLICSDGLTDLVPSDAIRRIAAAYAGRPDAIVRALIDAANDAGGRDNVTAVFVQGPAFTGTGAPRTRGADTAPAPGGGRRHWPLPLSVAVLAAVILALGFSGRIQGWPRRAVVDGLAPLAGAVVVRPDESIAAAILDAVPGTTVIVEPGEYRERIALKNDVRVVSRIARAAILRLPAGAAQTDAAVVAAGVRNAELSGFCIAGDAATPLGIGILARGALLRLVDLDISGASIAAIDIGGAADGTAAGDRGDGVTLAASDIHDNPGSAVVVRPGTRARVAHNVFVRNATSDRIPASVTIEPGAEVIWIQNVFQGTAVDSLAGTDATLRSSLLQQNWFLDVGPASSGRPAPGRGPQGR